MLKVLNYINVSRGTNMSNMLGLWLRHSPTPCGSQIKMCKHIFAWEPCACFT